MVAYSFKKQFGPRILAGTKAQTSRAEHAGRSRHARPGEMVQLYTGMRTRQCRRLGESRCIEVLPVKFVFSKRDAVELMQVGERHLPTSYCVRHSSGEATRSREPYASTNATPSSVSLRHATFAGRRSASAPNDNTNSSGTPITLTTRRRAPLFERFRTVQSIAPPPVSSICPSRSVRLRGTLRVSSIPDRSERGADRCIRYVKNMFSSELANQLLCRTSFLRQPIAPASVLDIAGAA